MNYDFGQLENIWIEAGGSSQIAPIMAAIALAESSGNPLALNPDDNGGTQSSYGLWQISNGTHVAPSANWSDPIVNAKLAIAKLAEHGLSPWGTYDRGTYLQYLPSQYDSYAAAISKNPKDQTGLGANATQSGGSFNTPISGLGISGTVLAYIDRALNPDLQSVDFKVFSLNFSFLATIGARAVGVLVGVGLLYIGMKSFGSSSPLSGPTSIIQLVDQRQRTRTSRDRLAFQQASFEREYELAQARQKTAEERLAFKQQQAANNQ